MHLPCVFHGEVGGTKEVYGPSIGIESLSGSPPTVPIWSRSLCGRRSWRTGDAREVWSRGTLVGSGGGKEFAYLLVRVGACADELRLMGVELCLISAGVTGAVTDSAFSQGRRLALVSHPVLSGCRAGPAERMQTGQ